MSDQPTGQTNTSTALSRNEVPPTPAARRGSRGGFLRRAALAVAATLLALVVAEFLCRTLAVPEPPMRFSQDVNKLNGFKMRQFAQVIQADPELFWRLGPNTRLPEDAWPFPGVVSNGQGFREDHEIAQKKPAGTIRLLFVGDSCTFGYGLKYNEGFVKRVEASLRAMLPGVSVECMNAGVPGYSLFQSWRFLETKGFDYHPDLIVLNFGWNDADQWDGMSDPEHYAAINNSRPPSSLRWSQLCERIWALTMPDRTSASKSAKRSRLSVEDCHLLLDKIRQAANRRGSGVLLLVWPMRMNLEPGSPANSRTPMQTEQQIFGWTHSSTDPAHFIKCVDLVPIAQSLGQNRPASEVFLDAGHATATANQEFATAIVAALEPWIRARAVPRSHSP